MNAIIIIRIIQGIGIWLIIDGVGSMILYEKQSWVEQAVRVVRCIAGVALIYLGYLLLG